MLPPKARAIFDVLADGKPRPRPEIAQALGYPSDQVRVGSAGDNRFGARPDATVVPFALLKLTSKPVLPAPCFF
jgi:hypothetical protein